MAWIGHQLCSKTFATQKKFLSQPKKKNPLKNPILCIIIGRAVVDLENGVSFKEIPGKKREKEWKNEWF